MAILFRQYGTVIELTLDWPEVRNALGPDDGRELREALEAATAAQDVAAIVLSANGKAFCAGGNLPVIAKMAYENEQATVMSSTVPSRRSCARSGKARSRSFPLPMAQHPDSAAIWRWPDTSPS
jgi:enoyl-CoA hydratase/carnithine racemase